MLLHEFAIHVFNNDQTKIESYDLGANRQFFFFFYSLFRNSLGMFSVLNSNLSSFIFSQ